MIKIDRKSTEEMIKNTEYRFLVHKGSYDCIYRILKNNVIVGQDKFVSFSDGFPLAPTHGDSIIVFDKDKLIEKGQIF